MTLTNETTNKLIGTIIDTFIFDDDRSFIERFFTESLSKKENVGYDELNSLKKYAEIYFIERADIVRITKNICDAMMKLFEAGAISNRD